jgi:hypothetical protein
MRTATRDRRPARVTFKTVGQPVWRMALAAHEPQGVVGAHWIAGHHEQRSAMW